jgi:hypothetical protein
MRAKTLGVMPPETYTQAMKTMSARRWRMDEPGPLGPPEKPVLLARAIEVAEGTGVTLDDLAAERGLPIRDLAWTSEPPPGMSPGGAPSVPSALVTAISQLGSRRTARSLGVRGDAGGHASSRRTCRDAAVPCRS